MSAFGPSVGEPGYLPYCGRCYGFHRMRRGKDAFECGFCGLTTRRINGEDMFDRTAPLPPKQSSEAGEGEQS